MGKTCKLWAWILAFCMVVSNLSMPVYASVGNGEVSTEDATEQEEISEQEMENDTQERISEVEEVTSSEMFSSEEYEADPETETEDAIETTEMDIVETELTEEIEEQDDSLSIETESVSDEETTEFVEEAVEESLEKMENVELQDLGTAVDSGSCGTNVNWTLYENGTLKITGKGKMDDFSFYSPWYDEHRNAVKHVEVGEGVTYIGASSFYSHYSLESVYFSSTVKTIGDNAFYGANKLSKINDYEEGLLRMPDTVERINNSFGCTGFTNVYLGGGLNAVGSASFFGLDLDTITVAKNIGLIESQMYGNSSNADKFTYETLYIGKEVTADWWRNKYAWKYMDTGEVEPLISSGILENYVTKEIIVDSENKEIFVSGGALYCKNETGYTLYKVPEKFTFTGFAEDVTITEIAAVALFKNTVSGKLVIPDTVTAIKQDAFKNCDNLTEVVLPSGLVSLGQTSFAYCDNLTKINIPKSLENNIDIDEYNYKCFLETPLNDITFEEGITRIPAGLFHSCLLSSITIPDTVIVLEDNVFRGCKNLTSIDIPEGVKDIGFYCFGDSGLKNATLPSTIELCKCIFRDCEMESVTIKRRDPFDFFLWNASDIQKIYGYKNSYANTLAFEKRIPFYDIDTGIQYEQPDYIITYYLNGGINNPNNPVGYNEGETIVFAEPTKEGAKFGGWYLKDNTEIDAVTGQDITIYAKWIEDTDFWIEDIPVQEYSGKAVKPEIKVYSGDTLLEEKKDYTVSYKNNTKAASQYDAKKAPTITITGKGNYAGKETATFTIWAKDMGEEDVLVENIVAKSTGKVQKPVPVVTYNGKKLKNKTDFTIEYPDVSEENPNAYKEAGTYTVLIKGTGNFNGEKEITFTITENNLMSKVSVVKIKNQTYTGSAITPTLSVKNGKTPLVEGTDYKAEYLNNTEIGTATVVLTGMGSYSGTKKVTFKITGGNIKKAKVQGVPKSVPYDGTAITAESVAWGQKPLLTVKINKVDVVLTEGTDYIIEYQNNMDKGTAAILFKGINGFSGTLKKTFKITPYDIEKDNLKCMDISMNTQTRYAKGGSKPKPVVKFGDTVLEEGKDYTLSYKNHTKVNDGSNEKKVPTVTIKGKGNFSGKSSRVYTIEQQSLSVLNIAVPDKAYKQKKNAYKSTPKITDLDGKALKAGTDYEKAFAYSYKNETTLDNGTVRNAGETVGADDIVPSGTVVVVTVTGKGNYLADILIGEYRVVKADISKARVSVASQIYTGSEIIPPKAHIIVKLNGERLSEDAYEIVKCQNNIKKGNAKITIKGVDNYGGTKTTTFKIKPRSFLWFWR